MTAVKKAVPAKSAAKATRSAKASNSAKAGSRAVATKPARAAAATARGPKPGATNRVATKAATRHAGAAAKKVVKPAKTTAAKKSVKGAKATPAKATPAKAAPAKAINHAKAHPPSTKKAATTKRGAPARTTARSRPGTTTAPPPKRAAAGPYAKDAKFLEEQQALLVEERRVYQGQAEDLQAEADSLAQEREPGDVQFDEESGEGGIVTVDRERDLALSAQALLAVEEIDDARRKIARKTYGACERCHEAIPKARLRALPFARLCVACKSGGLSRR
ncbi:MAG: TraR/DksA family transcriptional regulator [Acidimicrobiales bacterium]